MERIEHFLLPPHTNELYKKETISSVSLTKDVANKINELVDAYNNLYGVNSTYKNEIDIKLNKATLYMKDHLINTVNDLFKLLYENGDIDNIVSNTISKIFSRVDNVVTPFEFGAVGNGEYDDTIALNKALNSGKLVDLQGRTFYSSSPIESNNIFGVCNGTIKGNTITFNKENLILYNVCFDGCSKYNNVTVFNDNINIINCLFQNVKNSDSVSYGLNLRRNKNVNVVNCIFDNFTNEENAIRCIRLEDTANVNIDKCVFKNMNGVNDGDYIHIYSLDKPTYTNISNCYFEVNNCKSAIKVQSSNTNIFNNHFISNAENNRLYAFVRVQNGESHNVLNNYFYSSQKYEYAYININVLVEYCKNVKVKNNIFNHQIKTGYDATTGANIIKITETENIIIEENIFNWKLMFRLLYLNELNGKEPIIKDNIFVGDGCCVVFEEQKGSFIFEDNKVELLTDGNYLTPIFSNGSATVIKNDITFLAYSVISVIDNLVLKDNVIRNKTDKTVVDVIQISQGTGYLRNNTYDGNIRYQVKGNPTSLQMESICDQPTGTPLSFTMENVEYFPSRYKANKLDFGNSTPTFKPRNMQEYFDITSNKLLIYYNGQWRGVNLNAI